MTNPDRTAYLTTDAGPRYTRMPYLPATLRGTAAGPVPGTYRGRRGVLRVEQHADPGTNRSVFLSVLTDVTATVAAVPLPGGGWAVRDDLTTDLTATLNSCPSRKDTP